MLSSINIDKVKIILSYLADRVDNLYVTKLMKLLYYIDFISYAERGSSITNDTYYKLPYGPIPSFIKNEIDVLHNSTMESSTRSQLFNIIELKDPKTKYGKIVANKGKRLDADELPSYELELINDVITKLGNKSATVLSNKTHKEKPYILTTMNSVISYDLASALGGRKILD